LINALQNITKERGILSVTKDAKNWQKSGEKIKTQKERREV
jgi:hypothetical protein